MTPHKRCTFATAIEPAANTGHNRRDRFASAFYPQRAPRSHRIVPVLVTTATKQQANTTRAVALERDTGEHFGRIAIIINAVRHKAYAEAIVPREPRRHGNIFQRGIGRRRAISAVDGRITRLRSSRGREQGRQEQCQSNSRHDRLPATRHQSFRAAVISDVEFLDPWENTNDAVVIVDAIAELKR
jgi:hypothetical protein